MTRFWQALAAILAILWIVTGWRLNAEEVRRAAAELRGDSLRTEILADSLRMDSTLTFAFAEQADIQARLEQSDSSVIDLARRVIQANSRIRQLTRGLVTAEATIASLADSVGILQTPTGTTLTAQGEFNDGLLSGFWRFVHPPGALEFPYTVNAPFEQFTVDMGDGRVGVIARSTDTRVRVGLLETIVDRPPPVVEFRTSNRARGTWAALGFVACTALP